MTSLSANLSGAVLAQRKTRMRRLARAARIVSGLEIMVVTATEIAVLARPELLFRLMLATDGTGLGTPSPAMLQIASLLTLIPATIYLAALVSTWRLFGLFLGPTILDAALPAQLSRVGALAIAAALAGIIGQTLIHGVLTLDNPATRPELSIGITGADIAAVIFGFLLFAISLVVQEALVLKEENEGFL